MRRNLLVLTKQYQWLVPPFLYLFHKHWGRDEKLLVCSDQPLDVDLPAWVEWRRVPCYSEGSWPWQFWWGNGMQSILAEIDEPVVCLFLPDYWLASSVSSKTLDDLAQYVVRCGNVLRVGLQFRQCRDAHGKFREVYRGLEIVAVTPGCVHCGTDAGAGLGVAMWDRAKLLDLLEPHWSPWALEKLGSEKMWREHRDWVSIGVAGGVVRRVNAVDQHTPTEVDLRGLDELDQGEVKRWIPERYEIIV